MTRRGARRALSTENLLIVRVVRRDGRPICGRCAELRLCAVWDCRVSVFCFFQAEDGIRDATVTGVQTCALPIYDTATTRCYRDWSSDVCSSDLMIRHTRCYRDWSSDVCSSD